jgi:hypothetical protein
MFQIRPVHPHFVISQVPGQSKESPKFKDRGCDNVLPGPGYRTAMVESLPAGGTEETGREACSIVTSFTRNFT